MNRNNRLSLITGAQTIWSALHLIAGATIAGPNIVLLILQSLYRYISQTQTGWPSVRLCLFLSILCTSSKFCLVLDLFSDRWNATYPGQHMLHPPCPRCVYGLKKQKPLTTADQAPTEQKQNKNKRIHCFLDKTLFDNSKNMANITRQTLKCKHWNSRVKHSWTCQNMYLLWHDRRWKLKWTKYCIF